MDVFIVPIRNWNRQSHRMGAITLPVFIVPIRNWNLIVPSWSVYTFCSFYSTYKELKRKNCSIEWLHDKRFYSTYKELKPSLLQCGQDSPTRFYSTYKELKPRYLLKGRLDNHSFYSTYKELKRIQKRDRRYILWLVFIVPIRNWNLPSHNVSSPRSAQFL